MEFLLLADNHEEAFKVAMRSGQLEAFLGLLGEDVRPEDCARAAQARHNSHQLDEPRHQGPHACGVP